VFKYGARRHCRPDVYFLRRRGATAIKGVPSVCTRVSTKEGIDRVGHHLVLRCTSGHAAVLHRRVPFSPRNPRFGGAQSPNPNLASLSLGYRQERRERQERQERQETTVSHVALNHADTACLARVCRVQQGEKKTRQRRQKRSRDAYLGRFRLPRMFLGEGCRMRGYRCGLPCPFQRTCLPF
jgi:hypothetical protein